MPFESSKRVSLDLSSLDAYRPTTAFFDALVRDSQIFNAPPGHRAGGSGITTHRIDPTDWDAAVAHFDGICQDQMWAYGRCRWPSLAHEPLLFRRDGEVVGGALIKLQKLPLGVGAIAIAKWGPMLQQADHPQRSAIYRDMVGALIAEYADRRNVMLSILPRATPERHDEVQTLTSLGFKTGSDCSFPDRYFVNLTVSDVAQRKSLDQKWRYHLRKSESAGLAFDHGGIDEIDDFTRIYQAMTERKKFPDYSAYKTIQHLFELPHPLRPELFFVRHDGKAIAGAIVFKAGDTASYLYGATTDCALPLRAGYFMQWQIVNWLSQNTSAKWYDLGGTEGFNGLHQFKKGLVGNAGVIAAMPPMANYAGRAWPYLIGTGALVMRDLAINLRNRVAMHVSDRARPDQPRDAVG